MPQPYNSHASFESLAGFKAHVSWARWLPFCLCIFFVWRYKYLSYEETEQKTLFVFTNSDTDDFLYSRVMDFA